MGQGTVTGTVTTPIVLGTSVYGASLVVARQGEVAPSAAGAAAITAPKSLGTATLVNRGQIEGAMGRYSEFDNGGRGGAGILFEAAGTITNAGTVTGGTGGVAPDGYAGTGGVGIDVRHADLLLNTGSIFGGYGEPNFQFGESGSGGVGVFAHAGGTIMNRGIIAGGNGAYGSFTAGNGAVGVEFGLKGTLDNSGTITGGLGGYSMEDPGRGADAVDFLSVGVLHNAGLIQGGGYGGIGVSLADGGSIGNRGTIAGGADALGVTLSAGGDVVNAGTISGGGGFYGDYVQGGTGASGLSLGGGTAVISNTGTILGGAGGNSYRYGGGTGGRAVYLAMAGAATLVNAGSLLGGAGGESGYYSGGAGGVGAFVYGQTLANQGVIAGGLGGEVTGRNGEDYGGAGGDGVTLHGGLVKNRGIITGGAGGAAQVYPGGAGGVGMYLNAGTLQAISGTISGGAAGPGFVGAAVGYAVQFGGTVSATLVVDPGAVFVGGIEGTENADDVLHLGGHGGGTLGGFGAAGGINGISGIIEDAGARWTLSGSLSSATSLVLQAGSIMELQGADAGTLTFATGGETLKIGDPLQFSEELHGFGAGDVIIEAGIKAAGFRVSGETLALLSSSGATLASLDFHGGVSAGNIGLKVEKAGTEVYYKSSAADWAQSWHEFLGAT